MPQQKQSWLSSCIQRLLDLLEEPLIIGRTAEGKVRRKLHESGQFIYWVVRGVIDNRLSLRAAALSFTTLLALVPLLAVIFSISKNVLHDSSAAIVPKLLDKSLAMIAPQLEYMPLPENAAGPPAPNQAQVSSRARQEAVQKIQEFIGNVNATALGAVGSVLLFSVAIRLLMTIELSFNDIWGVRTGRSIWRKIVYYWTAITLGPLLLVTAMVITGSMEFSGAAAKLAMAASFGKVLAYLAPFVVLWVAFGLMYALMPNTHVRPRAAIIGGMLGGTLWQANSLLSTLYLSRVVTYSKIYGSLGIVPVLLVGLYFSWWIVLFGAQVSFTVQNLRAFLLRRASEKLNQQQREAIACRTVLLACQHFVRGANPPTMQEACDQLGVSQALLNQIVQRLVDGGVLSVIADEGRALQPARPPDALTLADVLRVMRGSGGRSGRPDDVVEKLLSDLCAAEQSSPSNVAFAELVAKLDSQVTIPFRSR